MKQVSLREFIEHLKKIEAGYGEAANPVVSGAVFVESDTRYPPDLDLPDCWEQHPSNWGFETDG